MAGISFDDLVPKQPATGPLAFDDLVPQPAAPEQPSTIGDVAQSLGSGLVRGAVELGMLPVTMKRLLDTYATPYEMGAVNAVRGAFGYDPVAGPTAEELSNEPVQNLLNSGQDAVRGVMDDNLHRPETTTGKYAETIGEFAAPGGIPSKAARSAGPLLSKVGRYAGEFGSKAALPGVTSEAAGQATEGTKYEPAARILGALFGNTLATVTKAANTPEAALRRALGPADAIDWQRALGLQNNSTGVRLTGPEAIAQAQGGATALPDLLRVVEGAPDGRVLTAPFFAARQGQVDTAVNGLLDKIAPQSPTPSVLGPRASEAATAVLDDARQGINAQTRPLYQAAETQTIPAAEFQALSADPRFQAALARLRGNPELAPDYAALPDNSVAVLDAVSKDLFARGEALANRANPLYGPELAGRSTEAASNARGVARDPSRGGSAEYDQALTEQARMRREQLQPLQEGPVGRIAAAGTTQQAGEALVPRNPLVGSEGETADAVQRLMAQDAETTQQLVRQELADRYAVAAKDTQSGSHEAAGIKFRNAIAGSDAQDAVLQAIMRNINAPAALNDMPELLDVLQATGRRKAIGSATDFNATIRGELSANAPVRRALDSVLSLGSKFVGNVSDAAKRAAYGRSLGALAEMFIDPRSVERIREASQRSIPGGFAEGLARTARQTGATTD
ncbi:hypothetical protein [Rhizobium leguminosarum]|uniref:hypothetical protein n=1 Tax=Rhizobium leguminosarum TaxID=384 RepID=UPI001AE918F9|nr:hypothetical protein [Rhizobium leguminosarum]MBP2442829.1 hypothetical protein [Rhizobium leguminosarum]